MMSIKIAYVTLSAMFSVKWIGRPLAIIRCQDACLIIHNAQYSPYRAIGR